MLQVCRIPQSPPKTDKGRENNIFIVTGISKEFRWFNPLVISVKVERTPLTIGGQGSMVKQPEQMEQRIIYPPSLVIFTKPFIMALSTISVVREFVWFWEESPGWFMEWIFSFGRLMRP